jgi:hypothetical protein
MIASSDTSHDTGIVCPKNTRLELRSPQSKYALKISWLPIAVAARIGSIAISTAIVAQSRAVSFSLGSLLAIAPRGRSGGRYLRPHRYTTSATAMPTPAAPKP